MSHQWIQLTFAYFDPGSGSMAVQALLGGGASLVVLVQYLWHYWMTKPPFE